ESLQGDLHGNGDRLAGPVHPRPQGKVARRQPLALGVAAKAIPQPRAFSPPGLPLFSGDARERWHETDRKAHPFLQRLSESSRWLLAIATQLAAWCTLSVSAGQPIVDGCAPRARGGSSSGIHVPPGRFSHRLEIR